MASHPDYSNNEDVKAVVEGIEKFVKDFYLTLATKMDGKNLFFSPFSVITAFSMVYIGSKDKTKKQMETVLHLPSDSDSMKKAFLEVITDFKREREEYDFRTSNMVYISQNLKVLDNYLESLTEYFKSSSKTVDFTQSEAICKEINETVEKETNSKIKDIVTPGIITPMTVLALVNAIYFKGLWVHQFDPSVTKQMPFWVSNDKSVEVPMMFIKEKFFVSDVKDLDARLLSMDYQGDRFSFNILLPNERNGLGKLEEKLADVNWEVLGKNARKLETQVFIPKFKLEEKLDLKSQLKSMGLVDLFSEECNLSGITGEKDLVVSAAVHKAFLEIDEKGSEAAAATVIAAVRCMARLPPPPPFRADHPFFFYIKDKASRLILFAGRFVSP